MPDAQPPRLLPVQPAEWTPEQAALLAPVTRRSGDAFNIFKTLARHPEALAAFLPWATHVLNGSSLPAREREILILRTAHLCGSSYEWIQHRRIGLHVGLSEAEIERVREGAAAPGWTAGERALLALADELHARQTLSDPLWAEMTRHWSERQCLDAIFAVGNYTLLAMVLNGLRVEIDGGL